MSLLPLVIPAISEELLANLGIGQLALVLDPEAASFDYFQRWLNDGHAGQLQYLCDERGEKRKSLKEVFPHFKIAIVFLFPYQKTLAANNKLKIADYVFAFGDEDYHKVLPQRIKQFFSILGITEEHYQTVVDTAPILERDLAYRAGLGWFGKNSMLLNKKFGSYFLIASAIFNVELDVQSNPFLHSHNNIELDHCGNCRACIDACPTKAILDDKRQIETTLCISSYTIELFNGDKVAPLGSESTAEVFGCDICQTVCPWNNKIAFTSNDKMEKSLLAEKFYHADVNTIISSLESMSKRSFKKTFAHTAMARTGRDSVTKNFKDKIN